MKKIVAGVLAVATLSTCAFTAVACEKDKENDTQASIVVEQTHTGVGLVLGEGKSNGIKLMSTTIPETEYGDYGIMPTAESAYTLTATITPSDAANHRVGWSVAWSNPTSNWATGKSPASYITVSVTLDSKVATVSCIQPFGEQIIIMATSQNNPNVKATCTVDYAQKVTAASLNIGNVPVNFGGSTEVQYEVSPDVNGPGGKITANVTTDSVYTIAEEFTKAVVLEQPYDTEQWFNMKDLYPTGLGFVDSSITNWHGEEYYFDYAHDMKNWVIVRRSGDICFDKLSTAEIIEYMSNITCPKLCTITLTLTGEHNTYTYSSQLVCTGYTNDIPVNAIAINASSYVF
jgi:hypothetical protein